MNNVRNSVGPAEAPINPPEQHDPEPTRYDDIDFDTVWDWRDEAREIRRMLPSNPKVEAKLTKLIDGIQKALDDARGFNDPQPEREDV